MESKIKISRSLLVYGSFLILVGAIGYLSNPERAKTALLSGGIFGTLSIVLGNLVRIGIRWSTGAATSMLVFLSAIFTWRASAAWIAVTNGQSEKLLAAVLISSMFGATLLMLVQIYRNRRAA